MKATWYEVLVWAARRQKPFSTIELSEALDEAIELGKRKRRAHTVTQKLWKWGYLRKPAYREERPIAEKLKLAAVGLRGNDFNPKPVGRGGSGRNQGRRPSVWILTEKGLWRAKKPRVLARKRG